MKSAAEWRRLPSIAPATLSISSQLSIIPDSLEHSARTVSVCCSREFFAKAMPSQLKQQQQSLIDRMTTDCGVKVRQRRTRRSSKRSEVSVRPGLCLSVSPAFILLPFNSSSDLSVSQPATVHSTSFLDQGKGRHDGDLCCRRHNNSPLVSCSVAVVVLWRQSLVNTQQPHIELLQLE